MTFRRSNINCCRYVKSFAFLLYQLTDLRLLNYKSHSIQHAAVSQPNMNELAATNIHVRSENELQFDDYTTAVRITKHIVRCCSSVIIQQQYIFVLIFIVAPCILTTLMLFLPTNALLYYTYKMLKYTVGAIMRCFNCIF